MVITVKFKALNYILSFTARQSIFLASLPLVSLVHSIRLRKKGVEGSHASVTQPATIFTLTQAFVADIYYKPNNLIQRFEVINLLPGVPTALSGPPCAAVA